MRLYYLVFILASLVGCQSSSGDSDSAENTDVIKKPADKADSPEESSTSLSDIEKQLDSLTTTSRQITYQRLLIKSDLDSRKAQTKALQTYGYNSTEYNKATKAVERTDRQNLLKTLGFLERYGVSENQSVGRMQADATWLIVSHSTDIKIYRKLYPAFEKSWKKEYLEGASFASFLQDFHQVAFGKRLELKNPYRTEEEIEALQKALKGELK
jgi:hypothetical protein